MLAWLLLLLIAITGTAHGQGLEGSGRLNGPTLRANLPQATGLAETYRVIDCETETSCSTGGGSFIKLLAYDPDISGWQIIGDGTTAGGTGITSLNGLVAATQNFAVGTSGTDFNISSVTSVHTFNLPDASGTNRGASGPFTNFSSGSALYLDATGKPTMTTGLVRSALGRWQVYDPTVTTGISRWEIRAGQGNSNNEPVLRILQNGATFGAAFNHFGRLAVGGSDFDAIINAIASGSGTVPLLLRGTAAQTADLLQIQDNTQGVLARVTAAGLFNAPSGLSYSFDGDPDTAYGYLGVDNPGIYAGGVAVADIKSTSFSLAPGVTLFQGSNITPFYVGAQTPGNCLQVSATVNGVEEFTGPCVTLPLASTGVAMETLAPKSTITLEVAHNELSSPGWTEGGTISPGVGATVDVAAGEGYIRVSNSPTAALLSFSWSATTSLPVAADTVAVVGVEYNGGAPQVVVRPTSSPFNGHDEFILGGALNDSGVIAVVNGPQTTGDAVELINRRFAQTGLLNRDEVTGGLVLGQTGTRNVTMTTGAAWLRLTRIVFAAIDTSTGGTFDAYYGDGGGGWTKTNDLTQWPNTQYDNGTGTLATMGNNSWANLWFYLDFSGRLNMVYGQAEYSKSAEALDEASPTSLPVRLSEFSGIVGKFTFQKNASQATIVSPFEILSSSGVISHSDLTNLLVDDHTQYLIGDASRGSASATLTCGPLPGSPVTGQIVCDSGDSNKIKHWDGSAWIDHSGGGAGGGGLDEFSLTRTSATVLTISAGTYRTGNTPYVFSLASTATITGGTETGTARIYTDAISGNLIVGLTGLTAANVSCGGSCSTQDSVTAYPVDSAPIAICTATSGNWDATPCIDHRGANLSATVVQAGIGMSQTDSNGVRTLNATGGGGWDPTATDDLIWVEQFLGANPVQGNSNIGDLHWTSNISGGGVRNIVRDVPGGGRGYALLNLGVAAGAGGEIVGLGQEFGNKDTYRDMHLTAAWTDWALVLDMRTDPTITAMGIEFVFRQNQVAITGWDGNGFGIRYDTTAQTCTTGANSTANWVYEARSSAGSQTCVDSGLAVAADTRYVLKMSFATNGQIDFEINGANAGAISTDMLSTGWSMNVNIITRDTAAKNIKIRKIAFKGTPAAF